MKQSTTFLGFCLSITVLQAEIVPPEKLYPDYSSINFCSESSDDCIKQDPVQTDIVCRYGHRKNCYCSGVIYDYVEYGEVCTRYSFRSAKPDPEVGNDPVIILPFNWGEEPMSGFTSDGKPFPLPENKTINRKAFPLYPVYKPIDDVKTQTDKSQSKASIKYFADTTQHLANEMMLGLYENQEEDENLLFSPVSLQMVLASLYEAAEDGSKTQEELQDALIEMTKTINVDRLRTYSRALLDHVETQDGINLENFVFLSSKANQDYAMNAYHNYSTDMIYFNRDNPESLAEINRIISQNTGGHISSGVKNIRDTDMFIINTIFLEGLWMVPFTRTKSELTFKNGKQSYKVASMKCETSNIKISLLESEHVGLEQLRVITIPMMNSKNGTSDLEMKIFQPISSNSQENSLKIMMNHIFSTERQTNIFSLKEEKEDHKEISLTLPIFKLRSSFDVTDFLKSNGINSIFTEEARLSKISNQDLIVENVSQELFVEVSEEGARAAAATIVDLAVLSASLPEEIVIETPFIFTFSSRTYKMPLVVGVVNNPNAMG